MKTNSYNDVMFKLGYFNMLSKNDKEKILQGIESNNTLVNNIIYPSKKGDYSNMDKYICAPDEEMDDVSCLLCPCVLFVAPGSPKPHACPYGAQDYFYCTWKKDN
jgi:hypothetical protein